MLGSTSLKALKINLAIAAPRPWLRLLSNTPFLSFVLCEGFESTQFKKIVIHKQFQQQLRSVCMQDFTIRIERQISDLRNNKVSEF
jgi:molybdopterin-guanine dinucleotide biosynthesis protein